jgi:octaprenyl-diphosphate synthase
VLTPAAEVDSLISPDLTPKHLLARALEPVHSELKKLDSLMADLTLAQTRSAIDLVKHVLGSGGKRIRPALFFLSAKTVGYQGDHLYPMAAVCEYVHTASLLHDDVIDNSTLRRTRPTANSIWGAESSVLVGDLIYSRASELMADTGSLEIVSMFAKAIRLMSDGELLQLEHLFDDEMSAETYFKILNYKTAVLIAACCRAPAVLAGSPPEASNALESFGSNLGIAFQLLDDALDYLGDEQILGKPILADLPEGKLTLPILLLKERAPAAIWQQVISTLKKKQIDSSDMDKIKDYVEEFSTADDTLALASKHTKIATSSLNLLPPSVERNNLEQLASSLLGRFF